MMSCFCDDNSGYYDKKQILQVSEYVQGSVGTPISFVSNCGYLMIKTFFFNFICLRIATNLLRHTNVLICLGLTI